MKRVIRILEYFGDAKWINGILKISYLKLGERKATGGGSIGEIARYGREEDDEGEKKKDGSDAGVGHEKKLD